MDLGSKDFRYAFGGLLICAVIALALAIFS